MKIEKNWTTAGLDYFCTANSDTKAPNSILNFFSLNYWILTDKILCKINGRHVSKIKNNMARIAEVASAGDSNDN